MSVIALLPPNDNSEGQQTATSGPQYPDHPIAATGTAVRPEAIPKRPHYCRCYTDAAENFPLLNNGFRMHNQRMDISSYTDPSGPYKHCWRLTCPDKSMWKYFATPMLALILCINHAAADSTTSEASSDHCATLTWPDGHQSRVDDFVEAPRFADVCASKSGCKIDGQEFSSITQLKNALSNATMKCLFPPANSLKKGECAEQQDSFAKELRSLTPSLSNACQRIFLDPRAPIFPSIEKQCAASNEPDKNWCLARKLATYYLRDEQKGEFVNIQQILLEKCPSPQLREYLKLRLYYLATQIEPGQLVGGTYATDFDFGPIDRQLLGPIRAHILYNLEGKEYEMAVEMHHPRKPRFFNRMELCQKAQQVAPRDAPQAARP